MSTEIRIAALEVVQTTGTQDKDDIWHFVCHCTDDNLSACGLDVTESPWVDGAEDKECPLCNLAWPDGEPCPWGCTCEECLG